MFCSANAAEDIGAPTNTTTALILPSVGTLSSSHYRHSGISDVDKSRELFHRCHDRSVHEADKSYLRQQDNHITSDNNGIK